MCCTNNGSASCKSVPFCIIKQNYSKPCCLKYEYNSISPGRKPNEPTVTDIRALSYNVEGYIDYKLNFDEDWKQLPSRHKASNEVPIYPPLNKSKLPIKKSKFDHLQAPKTVLPEDCQNFYDFLTYKND
nr:unnamed protein product [Callosobruchus analis]